MMNSMIRLTFITFSFLSCMTNSIAATFESCVFDAAIINSSSELKGSGPELSLLTKFKPSKEIKNNKSCSKYIGKELEKPLVFKSKQYIPFIKEGNKVTLDYSHFIIDELDNSLNMEVWKVLNVKTQRSDHD